jgi:hypothetical protein
MVIRPWGGRWSRRWGLWAFGLLVLGVGASVLCAVVAAAALRPDATPRLGPGVRVSPTAATTQRDPGTPSATPDAHDDCDGADAVDAATPPSAGDDDDSGDEDGDDPGAEDSDDAGDAE